MIAYVLQHLRFLKKKELLKIVRKFGFGKITLLILITTRMVCFLN